MSLGSLVFDFAVGLMGQFGYTGVFLLMVMESATLPVPSEVVLPLAGYLVYKGTFEFWTAVIVATLGSLVGTMIDYSIGFYLGRPAVLRYGRLVGIGERHFMTTEGWFRKRGKIIVLLARFVPLVRTLISFPAGIVKMDVKQFLVYSAIGIFIWDVALVYVGYVAGQNSAAISAFLESIFLPLGLAVALILIMQAYRSVRKKPPQSETN
ncbi:MAG TPA: DedA family protein [Candidatus Bathyarchaeia archaeon]|nr:DedA family protein [Candidatus Bathyarchaeia archaeon]